MLVPERLHGEYADLVLQELNLRAKKFGTVYLGGGSPSALSSENLRKLLASLQTNEEFTMEWNPDEVSDEKIKIALDFGVNRFSLGVQSLNNNLLKMLGRRHSAKTALNAFEKLNNAFSTGSCDLMFCLPGQSTADFLSDVETLVNLNAKHISFYGLTLKKEKKLPPQPEDLYPEMYLKAAEILEAAGLHRYEVSNFAMQGHESKHNLVYWKGGDYLGIGPSAHSYLSGVRSYVQGKYLPWKKWVLSGCPQDGLTLDIPSADGKKIESAWLALRTSEGLSKFDLKKAQPFIEKGWLAMDGENIRLNGDGWLWLDKIILEIL